MEQTERGTKEMQLRFGKIHTILVTHDIGKVFWQRERLAEVLILDNLHDSSSSPLRSIQRNAQCKSSGSLRCNA